MGRIKRKIKELFFEIISLPKSLYVCLRLLPFSQAIRIPILVRYNTKLVDLSGRACLEGVCRYGRVKIGFTFNGIFDPSKERCMLQIEGTLKIEGKAKFGYGSRISIGKNGVLNIGSGFNNSAKVTIFCEDSVNIGTDVLCSWDVLIIDTDFHETEDTATGFFFSKVKPISIGNNVWLCMRSLVLKGSIIPNGCIVASAAVVNKAFSKENCLLGGQPATIRKENITRHKKCP